MKQKNFKVGDVVRSKAYGIVGLVGRIVKLDLISNPHEMSRFDTPYHIATIASSRRQAEPYRIYAGRRKSRWCVAVALLALEERPACHQNQ
jgi:hypothetical protein